MPRQNKTRQRQFKKPLRFGFSVVAALLIGGAVYIGLRTLQSSFAEAPPAPAGKTWRLAWSDEFNGSSVDTSKWNIENSNFGRWNSMDSCFTPGNVEVSGGVLHLIAKRQTVVCNGTNPDSGNNTYHFTSGMVSTWAGSGPLKFKFTKGYVEARLKIPKGNPYWPAFWLIDPADGSTPTWPDYGEMDIAQMYGGCPDLVHGFFQYKCGNGSCKTQPTWFNVKNGNFGSMGTLVNSPASFSAYSGGITDFHNYGLLWEDGRITWYVDGRRVRFYDGKLHRVEANGAESLEQAQGASALPLTTVFNYSHSILLNLAVGGDGPRYAENGYTGNGGAGSYNNGNFVASMPDGMQVDYVRVYQLAGASGGSSPAPSPTPSPTPSSGGGSSLPPAGGGTNEGSDDEILNPDYSDDVGSDDPTIFEDAPTVESTEGEMVSIAQNNRAVVGETVLNASLATDPELQAKVDFVEYLVNDKVKSKISQPPFAFDTTKLADGTYNLTEKVHLKDGKITESNAYIVVRNSKAAQTAAAKKMTAKKSGLPGVLIGGIAGSVVVLLLIPAVRFKLGDLFRWIFRRNRDSDY